MSFDRIVRIGALGLAVLSLSGCFTKKKPPVVIPPVVVPQPQPQPQPAPEPPPEPKPAPKSEEQKPVVKPQPAPAPEPQAEPPKLEKPSPAPSQRKRTPAAKPAAQAPIPQLGTILTAEQRAQYQKTCDESLRKAKNALNAVSGKKLSSSQSESASRVRSFIRQAEELKSRDLTTAAQLAQRADLLAQQLVRSLQ